MIIKEYKQENSTLPTHSLCAAFGLARSSFYAGVKSLKKNFELDKIVWNKMVEIWKKFPGLGYRKLATKLDCNGKKVLRILRRFRNPVSSRLNPKPVVPRRIPNVIKLITQDLKLSKEKCDRGNWILREGKNKYRHIIDPTRPYQLWAGDWKELKIPLLGVTLYIFTIIDCFTRQLMAWELSIIKDSNSAIKVAESALSRAAKDPLFNPRTLIMHTDQGGAYIADAYISYWRSRGVILSTADKGKPTQNPYAEAFFSILSRFCLRYKEIITVTDAKESIMEFFSLYNEEWPHGAIGNMTPNQKLAEYRCGLESGNYCPVLGS